MEILFVCEVCREELGYFDTETLGRPMASYMFTSLDPARAFPLPFNRVPKDTLWEFLRCPYCNIRPFLCRDKVMTHDGYYEIGTDKIPGVNTGRVSGPDHREKALTKKEKIVDLKKNTGKTMRQIAVECECKNPYVSKVWKAFLESPEGKAWLEKKENEDVAAKLKAAASTTDTGNDDKLEEQETNACN